MCNCGNNGCGGCGGVSLPAGPAGPNGLNAFTFTTASFAQPTLATAAIVVPVSGLGQYTGLWATVGQWIFIEGAGTFVVTARTPTSITIDVPNAAIEALNNAIRTLGQTVTAGKAVSPSGVQGVQGIQGAPGTNGTNASELITYKIAQTPQVPSSPGAFSDLLNTPVTIPANTWSATGDLVKLVFVVMGTVGTNNATINTDYIRYQFRIVINGTPIDTMAMGAASGKAFLNGILLEVDLIGVMNGGFVDIYKHKQQQLRGLGTLGTATDFTAGAAYAFLQDPSISVYSTASYGLGVGLLGSVNPTVSNTIKIDGTYGIVGTGGTNIKELAVGYLRASVHKAP